MHVAKSKRGGKKTILNKKNPSHSKEKEVRVSVHESTHLSYDVLDTFITPPQPASLSLNIPTFLQIQRLNRSFARHSLWSPT